jgi:hypothetical protein
VGSARMNEWEWFCKFVLGLSILLRRGGYEVGEGVHRGEIGFMAAY